MPTPAEFISFIEVPNLNPTVSPTYYYMTDPGKEGLWKYDSSDQSGTANIGTILAISTSPTSRVIKRIFDGAVVVTWFGAIGDGTTDNYSKIKNAIETCCTLDITTLEFPPGNYMVDRGDPTTDFIAITKNLHLKGNQAILNVDTSGNTYPNLGAASNRKFLTATGLTSLTLSGIIFKWTTKLNSALSTLSYGPYDPSFLFVVSSSNIKISKCEFYFAGIDFDDSSDIVIEGCVLKNGWNNTTYHAGAKLGNGLGNIRFKQIHLDFNELQENVFIRDNIFYNVVNAFYSSNINNLVFHRNKIEKTADTAVFDRCISQKKPSRRDISHNIFKDIGKSAIKTLDANNEANASGEKAFGSCALVSFNIIENWSMKLKSAAILSANNYVTEDNDSSYQEVSDFSKRSSQLNIIGNIIRETENIESPSCGLLFQIINTQQVIIAENNVDIRGLYDLDAINKLCTYCNDVVISNNIFKTKGTFGIKRCENVRIANNHFIAGNNGTNTRINGRFTIQQQSNRLFSIVNNTIVNNCTLTSADVSFGIIFQNSDNAVLNQGEADNVMGIISGNTFQTTWPIEDKVTADAVNILKMTSSASNIDNVLMTDNLVKYGKSPAPDDKFKYARQISAFGDLQFPIYYRGNTGNARLDTVNKKIDISLSNNRNDNSLINYGSKLGVHTSDSGSNTITIPHGLGAIPTFFRASAASVAAKNIAYVTANATNIIVNYDVINTPPMGTNNIIINWEARL